MKIISIHIFFILISILSNQKYQKVQNSIIFILNLIIFVNNYIEFTMSLNRFIEAQNGIYSRVLDELKSYKKTSHWMWFIFPQIKGLGTSPMATKYAIQDLEEAKEYLKHPELSKRLNECIQILLENKNLDIKEVFGFLYYL